MKTTKLKFDALDALRGIAAIAVAIFHFNTHWAGYLAVDFFLVLSGFVLSHSYLYKDPDIKPVGFISHRISRLYPLHFFTLIAYIIVYCSIYKALPVYKDGTIFTFMQHLTLTQNIGLNPHGGTFNYPNWSISVEFWVNILFILFITKKTKNSSLFFIALIGLLVIYGNTGSLDTHYKNYFAFVNSGIIRGVSSFFLGIISYRIYLNYREDVRVKNYINFFEVISVIGILFIVFARRERLSGIDFFAPFLFMFVVSIFAFEYGYLSKHIKLFKYLGEISYSIYLNQISVLMIVRWTLNHYALPPILYLFVYLFILIIISHFTYIYIEKPFRKKGRDVFARITIAFAETK